MNNLLAGFIIIVFIYCFPTFIYFVMHGSLSIYIAKEYNDLNMHIYYDWTKIIEKESIIIIMMMITSL